REAKARPPVRGIFSTQSPHRLHSWCVSRRHSGDSPATEPAMHRLLPVLRIASILFLTLLLLLPMGRIRELIRERQGLRDQVVAEVARSDAHAQTLTGPVVIVPYTRTLREQELDRDQRVVTTMREVAGELRLLPSRLEVEGELRTEERQRGIYRARIYPADARLSGVIDIPASYGVVEDLESYRFGTPHLALGISDIRGIGNALVLRADGAQVPFQPGTGTSLLASGVQAPLADVTTAPRRIEY